jgi:hypothetical protein
MILTNWVRLQDDLETSLGADTAHHPNLVHKLASYAPGNLLI